MSGRGLRIARGLTLDADYVGAGTLGILAKKGAGKSYLARVLAEEFWDARVPFVLMDPMGTSWGLRVDATGEGEGIPVPIFGGAHGDAPLERKGGALLADLVVDERLSMVLDMSELGTRAAEREFALDFFDRLYRRNSELVHLLVDEADLFAPQKPQAGDRQLLGMTENIVRRGRNRGIGISLITQRPAVLNKDVLTQIDALVALRTVGVTDRKALDEWVKGHGEDEEHAAEVKTSLAHLANGECWWWIPELGVLERVQVRESRTFDSSPSRKRSRAGAEPKSFADVDMEAIEERMADTIERAKAEDPKELRQRVRELEKQLAARPTEQVEVEKVVEVPVLTGSDRELLEGVGARFEQAERTIREYVMPLPDELLEATSLVRATAQQVRGVGGAKSGPASPATPTAPRAERNSPSPAGAQTHTAPGENPAPTSNGEVTRPQQRILDALAALDAIGVTRPGKTQLALFAGVSPRSSGYEKNLSTLRTAGLIDYPEPGCAALTAEGRELADDTGAPRTQDEMLAYVRDLVRPAKWNILEALIEIYPDSLSKDELAERIGVSARSSGYEKNLSTLRSLGLADYPAPGTVAATEVLFP